MAGAGNGAQRRPFLVLKMTKKIKIKANIGNFFSGEKIIFFFLIDLLGLSQVQLCSICSQTTRKTVRENAWETYFSRRKI